MTQLHIPLRFPRFPRLPRLRFADRPNQLRERPAVHQPRPFVRCGRHGLVTPTLHRIGVQVCSRCRR